MGFLLGDIPVYTHVVTRVTNSTWLAQEFLSFSSGCLLFQSLQSLANLDVGYLSSGQSDHYPRFCFNDCSHHLGRGQERAKETQFAGSGSHQGHQNGLGVELWTWRRYA